MSSGGKVLISGEVVPWREHGPRVAGGMALGRPVKEGFSGEVSLEQRKTETGL